MRQGFYVNSAECVGCRTCQVACKDKNALEVGILFRQVHTYEVGEYPEARIYNFPSSCNHCETPACVANCSTGAMYIDDEDGTIQHDDTLCDGCQACAEACPYSAPQFIAELNVVHKCDAYYQLRENGEQPACVAACPMRALEFGDIEELRAAHPDAVNQIAVLPEPTTNPSVAIDAKDAAFEDGAVMRML